MTDHRAARATLLLAALCAAAGAAQALTTYTYTAPITSWYDAGGRNFPLYAALDGSPIELKFTVDGPLAANAFQWDITSQVRSWSYKGGSAFLQQHSGGAGSFGITVWTDGAGAIWAANFGVSGPVVIPTLEAYTSSMTMGHGGGYDQQTLYSSYLRLFGFDIRGNALMGSLAENMSNDPGAGTWTMTTSVPETGTAAMLAAGLGLLGALRRRYCS